MKRRNSMKIMIQVLAAVALVWITTVSAQAQEGAVAGQPAEPVSVQAVPPPGRPDGSRAHDRFNEKYDKELFDRIAEKDGYISFEDFSENATARDTIGGRVDPEYLRGFDADGDGQLNLQEAKKARQDMWRRTTDRAQQFKENHPNADWQDVKEAYRERREDRREERRERYMDAKEKHPVAVDRATGQALQHPEAAKKLRRDALEHDKARKKLYRDAKENPQAADWAADRIENNKKDAKRAYQSTTDKEKRDAYRASKKNRERIKDHPGPAKRRAGELHRNR